MKHAHIKGLTGMAAETVARVIDEFDARIQKVFSKVRGYASRFLSKKVK